MGPREEGLTPRVTECGNSDSTHFGLIVEFKLSQVIEFSLFSAISHCKLIPHGFCHLLAMSFRANHSHSEPLLSH